MSPKVLINIPVTFHQKYLNQIEEGKQTWGKYSPYPIIYSVPNPLLDKEYSLKNNYLSCKCTDELNYNFSLKRFYFIKWAIDSNQKFDYLFLTDTDTFVHPYRLQLSLENYFINNPEIDFIGEMYPRGTHPSEENGKTAKFWVPTTKRVIINRGEIEKIKAIDKVWGSSNIHCFPAGGVGYILSKKAAQTIVNNFNELLNIIHTLDDFGCMDDLIISQFFYSKGIHLYNDNSFSHFSPKFNLPPNIVINIEDSQEIIAQHERQGEFRNIMNKMNLW